jgi:hypothetical protein
MVWPKEASKHKDHIGIVRANKRGVNEDMSGSFKSAALLDKQGSFFRFIPK